MNQFLWPATLDHLRRDSPEPERLARFYGELLGDPVERIGPALWQVHGPARRMAVGEGEAAAVPYFALSVADADRLPRLRQELERAGVPTQGVSSPLLGPRAFKVTDPDGRAVVFDSPRGEAPQQQRSPAARLQHFVCATSRRSCRSYAKGEGPRMNLRSLFLGIVAASLASVAGAQAWPSKPVRLISQFPPGGGTDLIARNLMPELSKTFGQNFILENKPGAAGNIAADYVAKSAADGYTILIANNTIVIQAALPQTLAFDVERDFTPIGTITATPVALAVHPSQPVRTVQDLIALARAQQGKLAYSSCGTGTAMHLAGELFKQLAKIDMIHVPYKGCGPAIIDGISGQVPILFNTITNTAPQAKGGRLRIVAIASATRSPVDKNLPTIAEAGLTGFDADIWFGFMGPAALPREIVTKLNAELNRIVKLPDVSQRLADQLFDIRTGTPEQFGALIKSDIAKWTKVVRDGNIKPE